MVGKHKANLAYTTAGDPANPALMLLHGFMSSNGQWLPNIPALTEHFFLVMVELWGHGTSPTPTAQDRYSVAAYAEEFERIRTTLNLSAWGVIGQSYGAGLVVHYALNYTEACVGVATTNSRSAFGRLTSELSPATTTPPASADNFDPRALPYHPVHARRFPADVKTVLVENADQMSADAVRLGGLLGRTLYVVDRIPDLHCPLLVVNGKFEKSFQAELAHVLETNPSLQVAHLDGGHSVNIEAASAFDTVITKFFHGAFAENSPKDT